MKIFSIIRDPRITSDRSPLPVTCRGELHLQFFDGKTISISAYCVPTNEYNLLSTTDMEARGAYFCATHGCIETQQETTPAMIVQTAKFNWLSCQHIIFPDDVSPKLINAVREKYPLEMVHRLLGT